MFTENGIEDICETRMHSSRMRIARLLTVSCSIPCILEGGLPNPQMPTPWMQTPPLDADPLVVDPLDADSSGGGLP